MNNAWTRSGACIKQANDFIEIHGSPKPLRQPKLTFIAIILCMTVMLTGCTTGYNNKQTLNEKEIKTVAP